MVGLPDQSQARLDNDSDDDSSSSRSGIQVKIFAACWSIAAVSLLVLHPLLLVLYPLSNQFPSDVDALLVYSALCFFLAPFAILASGSCCTWLFTFLLLLVKLPFVTVWYMCVFSFQMVVYLLHKGCKYGVAGVKFVVFCTPPLTYFWRHWTFQSPRFGWQSIPESRTKMSDSEDQDEERVHYSTTSQLCEGCLGIVEKSGLIVGSSRIITPREEMHVWLLHIKGVEIYGEDQVGCHLCNILWYTMKREARLDVANGMNFGRRNIDQGNSDDTIAPDSLTYKQEVEQVVQLNVKIFENFEGRWYEDGKRYIQVYPSPGMTLLNSQPAFLISEVSLRGESASIEVPSWTGAPDCIELTQDWIQRCETDHALCRHLNSRDHVPRPLFLPTRLVYVGSLSSPVLRIHTTTPDEDITYLALSHCWGPKKFETLTIENQDAWSRDIEIGKLPANFQDAIHFSRSIGQRYIWIDSMCIIQNCTEDWAREAVKMSTVYSQAYCTISASGAADANGGCFQTRNPLLHFPCNLLFSDDHTLAIKTTDYDSTSNRAPQQKVQFSALPVNGAFSVEVNHSPLSKRAWALQERLLSKRIVHFGANYVFFECGLHFASELLQGGHEYTSQGEPVASKHFLDDWLSLLLSKFAGGTEKKGPTGSVPSSRYDSVTGYRAAFNSLRQFEPSLSAHDYTAQIRLHQNWFELVSKFTSADLTNTADRLIAIHGIAQGIQEPQEPPNYIAGLWKMHLPYDLLWYVDSHPLPRPEHQRAPSWSWGAIDGKVAQDLFVPQVDREDNDFNIVTKAQVHAVEMEQSGPGTTKGYIELDCYFQTIKDVVLPSHNHDSQSTLILEGDHRPFEAAYYPDDTTSQPTVCVELVSSVTYFPGWQGTWSLESHGIALRPLSSNDSSAEVADTEFSDGLIQQYERVGRYKAVWQMDDKDVSAFVKAFNGDATVANTMYDFCGALRDAGKGYFVGGVKRRVKKRMRLV